MLTEIQKNVAVRLVLCENIKSIAQEFRLTLKNISDWLKVSEFIEYKNELSEKGHARVTQYLDSKRMKYVGRLEELSDQADNLAVAHKSTVDLLGFGGMVNRSIPAPVINQNNQNMANAAVMVDQIVADDALDGELAEIEELLVEAKSDGEPNGADSPKDR